MMTELPPMTTRDASPLHVPGVVTPQLIGLLRREFRLDWNGFHGAAHWARVRVNGLRLALHNGADTRVVEYFAFLHDVCRENEGRDPEHGLRAARFAASIRREFIALDDDAFDLLITAIAGHTGGKGHDNLTVCTCWDADRLDLPRVGTATNPQYLCTHEARDPLQIGRAREAAHGWLRNHLRNDCRGHADGLPRV